jgi:glycosyltransferase involved in cell wall biosynthesis
MIKCTPESIPFICSIIITNYNYQDYVVDAILSAFGQTYQKKEIIVVDDCSTDNSWAVINNFVASLPQEQKDIIKIIKTPTNGGTAKARNCGIQAAKGDFFAFLDADDVYYPEKVAYSMFKMTEFPTVGLVYSDYDEYNINGNNQIIRQYKEPFSFQNLLNRCIVSTNPVIAKQAFMSVGLYNENIKGMEDYELALRIGSKHTMVHVPIALFKYNNHGKNKTLTTPKEAWAKEEQLMKQNFIRMMQNGPAKR